jgi:N-acetylmuramoyl-L-alanine amidase/Putative peptidoglycan binding domain
MKIVDYPLSSGRWYAQKQLKKYIIWHGTQGRTAYTPSNRRPGEATSSIDGWNAAKKHIGTPFLVDRDGTIFRTFKDDREWIFHLGLAGTQGRYDKASIGIEFANELELIAADGKFYAFDCIQKNTEYTGPRAQRTWREHDWWACLDEAQVDAAIELTVDLCTRHGIPKTFYYPSTVYDFPHCFEVAGVLCHSNCRKDKTDLMLEDWVWDKLRAAGFQLVGESDSVSKSPAIAVSVAVASSAPITATLEVRPVASLGRAKVQSPDGTLNVRSAPKASARKLRALKNDDVVDIFGVKGDWAAIAPSADQWVARQYLKPVEAGYTLRSALLANDPMLRQIAETSLVLIPPQHPEPVSGIEAIQEAINRLATAGVPLRRINFGADDKYRGWFGEQTANALRAFQRFAGIGVDAKIGDETLRALDDTLVSKGVGGPMPTDRARQPEVSLATAKKRPAVAPMPVGKFVRTLVKVFNRGIPPLGFLQELVAWGKMAPEEIFVDQPGNKTDVYASVITELGPFEDITYRKACMLEVMRVLAGFESSWKWNTGIDTTRKAADTSQNSEAGAWQVSADSLAFGRDLKDLVMREVGTLKGIEFQKAMKANHPLAMEYVARLMRHTMRHNGPLFKNRSKFKGELREKEQSIYPWLSRDAAKEFQQLLTA